jgi:hypothetical protein
VVVAVLLAPLAGRAQPADAGPALEDPRAPKYADVERGVSVGMEVGWLGFFKTPVADPAKFQFAGEDGGASGGIDIGVTVGFDIGTRVTLSLFGMGTNQKASPSYGAFSVLAGGADVRWNFYGKKDRNAWERFYAYAHARGGYAVTYPEGLFGTTDLILAGGLGIEYYAQLRHFSVGLQVDGIYATKAGAPGLAITPTIRYTF